MEQLHNGITLELCDGAFPLSTDSVVLSGFVQLHKNDTVLDLGSGCGTLGLLLCAKSDSCKVTGIELDENAHLCALRNIDRNGLAPRLSSICADIANIPSLLRPGSFSCVISNPPYFCAGPQSKQHPLARRDDLCSMTDLFAAAAWAVKYGGDFYLVHRPERLAEICAAAAAVDLQPKRLCLLRHKQSGPVTLILLQCRKGGKPGLLWEELCLHDANGDPTEDYRKLYNLKEAVMAGMLYLVPTPIGNLGDISQRCRETLEQADFIAAEDTRVSLKLLNHLGIKKSLVSYYEHNKAYKGNVILERILAGETCALVSDAGSPAISDPGEDLVRQCAEAGITVCAIPGPCAVITGLSISGLPTGRFCFEGFLSTSKKSRSEHLQSLKDEQRTMIFYEAPHKLVSTLQDMAAVFSPQRPISLCRELTKLHEEVVRTTLGEAIEKYTAQSPKGEFVLVVAGAQPPEKEVVTQQDAAQYVKQLMEQGLSRKDAIKQTVKALNLPKNVVYDAALSIEE